MDSKKTLAVLESRFPGAIGPARAAGSVATLTPTSLDEAIAMVRLSAEMGVGICPTAAPAAFHRGTRKAGWVDLSTECFNRVISHEPRDLTVEVEAGLTLGALNEMLGSAGQHLPIDPPRPGRTTVGELIATNASGPLRFGHGTVRDFVLSMRMILADGRLVKSGAKVAKNTAGFDVHKLFIGSRGSLGLIATASLRVRPLPERFSLVLLHPPDATAAGEWLDELMTGLIRPVLIELVNGRAAGQLGIDAPAGAWMLVVGLAGAGKAVEWQGGHLSDRFGERVLRLEGAEARQLYEAVRDWPARDHAVGLEASIPSSEVASFAAEAARLPLGVIAHAGNGIVLARSGEPIDDEALGPLFERVARSRGSLRTTRLPPGSRLPRWVGRSHDLDLMRRVKAAFDPAGLFNPLPF